MKETLNYLPEDVFETKKDGQELYYHPPEEPEEFLKHYELYRPVRLWVDETIEGVDSSVEYYSILGVWADSSKTVKFVPSDFEYVNFE